jgi:hypothetical protein
MPRKQIDVVSTGGGVPCPPPGRRARFHQGNQGFNESIRPGGGGTSGLKGSS